MTPQELKASILQLAIQGKLVEQRPEEGRGGELLERIFAAKNAKDAKGAKKSSRAEARVPQTKAVREADALAGVRRGVKAASAAISSPDCPVRPSCPVSPADAPFDIPESWVWVRLGDCTNYADKKAKILPEDICPETWSLDLEDIEKETGKITNFRLAKDRRITGDKVVFHKGEILYSKLRPYLKKILVAPKEGICTPELVPFSPYGDIDANYLVIVLKSPSVDFAINSVTYGVKMPRVGTDTMLNLLIPLPPLAEQKRIVAKIEELLPYIDRYEKAWSKLEDFNKRFPGDMQKSLLQMAIQGKLVDQRPEEGTGEELYRQIQTEKQRLIKAGKLRKTKPLPKITKEDLPDDFPDSWKMCYIDDIAFVTKLAGFEYTNVVAPNLTPKGIPLFKGKNIQNGELVLEFESYIPETVSNALPRSQILKKCLLTPYVGTIGNIAIFDGSFKAHLGSNVGKIELLNGLQESVVDEYVLYYLRSPIGYDELTKFKKATAQESISIDAIRNVIIPLPPLAEQKRIVAKLEGLLPLCERLK